MGNDAENCGAWIFLLFYQYLAAQLTEAQVLGLARRWLHDNPRELYGV